MTSIHFEPLSKTMLQYIEYNMEQLEVLESTKKNKNEKKTDTDKWENKIDNSQAKWSTFR